MNDRHTPPLEQPDRAAASGLPEARNATEAAKQAEPVAASGSVPPGEEIQESSDVTDAALLALLGMC